MAPGASNASCGGRARWGDRGGDGGSRGRLFPYSYSRFLFWRFAFFAFEGSGLGFVISSYARVAARQIRSGVSLENERSQRKLMTSSRGMTYQPPTVRRARRRPSSIHRTIVVRLAWISAARWPVLNFVRSSTRIFGITRPPIAPALVPIIPRV